MKKFFLTFLITVGIVSSAFFANKTLGTQDGPCIIVDTHVSHTITIYDEWLMDEDPYGPLVHVRHTDNMRCYDTIAGGSGCIYYAEYIKEILNENDQFVPVDTVFATFSIQGCGSPERTISGGTIFIRELFETDIYRFTYKLWGVDIFGDAELLHTSSLTCPGIP